jgi:hypothetical protein
MQGQILQLDDQQRTGLILGEDGKRYGFTANEWRGSTPPLVGSTVDFISEDDKAREIFPLNRSSAGASASSSAYAAPTDNSVVLGGLGVACLALSFMIPVLPLIAAFILGLMGAGTAKQTGNSNGLLLSRIAWIGSVVMVLAVVAMIALGLSFLGLVAGISMHELMRGNWGSLHHTVAMFAV